MNTPNTLSSLTGAGGTRDDLVTKAIIRLQALCGTMSRISGRPSAAAMYVSEYEDILRQLTHAGVDVSGFEIPESAMPGVEDGVRNCDREFFEMRLAGLLLHLSTLAQKGSAPDPTLAERILEQLRSRENDIPF